MNKDTKTCIAIAVCFLVPGLILVAISTTATDYLRPLYYVPGVACVFSGGVALGMVVWTLDFGSKPSLSNTDKTESK